MPRGRQRIHGFFEAHEKAAPIDTFLAFVRQRQDRGDLAKTAGHTAKFTPDFVQ
jgi:hypothetical protein